MRYKIAVNQKLFDAIYAKHGDAVGSSYDYLCGHLVGAQCAARSPYFEFDDRSPRKYLFVGSLGADDPPIDLNSMQF